MKRIENRPCPAKPMTSHIGSCSMVFSFVVGVGDFRAHRPARPAAAAPAPRQAHAARSQHHAQEIDETHPEPVPHAVVRAAARARPMAHRHRDHPAALAQHQCGQKAVHVVEVRQLQGRSRARTASARSRCRAWHHPAAWRARRWRRATTGDAARCRAAARASPPAAAVAVARGAFGLASVARSSGMSAGSFWPSPSSVATRGARAAHAGRRWPCSARSSGTCRSTRRRGNWRRATSASTCGVASRLASST